MRLAKDLHLVEQERFPGLPADLKAAGAAQASVRPDGEKVISLEKSRGGAGAFSGATRQGRDTCPCHFQQT
jgi:hypothetical protein